MMELQRSHDKAQSTHCFGLGAGFCTGGGNEGGCTGGNALPIANPETNGANVSTGAVASAGGAAGAKGGGEPRLKQSELIKSEPDKRIPTCCHLTVVPSRSVKHQMLKRQIEWVIEGKSFGAHIPHVGAKLYLGMGLIGRFN